MDSNTAHNPVFMVFPPGVTVSEFQSMDYTATTYESSSPFPKLLATKVKIFGTTQILLGLMNFSFGIIFLFTFEKPYPRYPFIFVTGYPFWSSILFINSGAFLVALERKTTKTLIKTLRHRINDLPKFLSSVAARVSLFQSLIILSASIFGADCMTDTLVKMSQSMNFFSALAAIAGIILLAFGFIVDQNYICSYSGEASECKAVTALFIGILTMLMAFSMIELLISMSFAIFTRTFDCCACEK